MFVRVLDGQGRCEKLLNFDHVSKIEVVYAVPVGNGSLQQVPLARAATDPGAVRAYLVFVGSESFQVDSKPGCPLYQLVEGIYRDAVRATESPPGTPE